MSFPLISFGRRFIPYKNNPTCLNSCHRPISVGTCSVTWSHLRPKKMNYLFFDEIQMVENFQKVIDSVFLLDNVDIYVTGSNAYLLSGEIATLLTGRYVEIKLFPFSFPRIHADIAWSNIMGTCLSPIHRTRLLPIHPQQINNDREMVRGMR